MAGTLTGSPRTVTAHPRCPLEEARGVTPSRGPPPPTPTALLPRLSSACPPRASKARACPWARHTAPRAEGRGSLKGHQIKDS